MRKYRLGDLMEEFNLTPFDIEMMSALNDVQVEKASRQDTMVNDEVRMNLYFWSKCKTFAQDMARSW